MIQQAGLSQSVLDAVDQATPELLDPTRFIHAHPELAMQEHQAASLMTGCRLELGESETPYDDAVPNLTLARAIQAEFDAALAARENGLVVRDSREAPAESASTFGGPSASR